MHQKTDQARRRGEIRPLSLNSLGSLIDEMFNDGDSRQQIERNATDRENSSHWYLRLRLSTYDVIRAVYGGASVRSQGGSVDNFVTT